MADAKPKPRNDALRLLGLPPLPRKLPSRNWLIFWTVTTTVTAAIIYDSREKRRATARWAAAVTPLAHQPISNPSAMPRRITVFLEAPPGDTLRAAQDHFSTYIKPILASSGLDWDFVVGRQQGDVRAVVAERVRRSRRAVDKDFDSTSVPDAPTGDDTLEEIRRKNGVAAYAGVKGDIVVGRHAWKEYVRGLHEGWLGPLTPPPEPPAPAPEPKEKEGKDGEPAEEKPAEEKSKRPAQLPPYDTPEQYPSSSLPRFIPGELGPSVPIPFPHILGFLNTPTRMRWFLNRRTLADDIGREVAAICFGAYREYRESGENGDGYEQAEVLAHEEENWVKSVWKEAEEDKAKETKETKETEATAETGVSKPRKEKIWASPIVFDSRIASRMRRFTLSPEEEQKAREIVVPEEQVEGWAKGKLRLLGRWAVLQWEGDQKPVNVGNLDDVEN